MSDELAYHWHACTTCRQRWPCKSDACALGTMDGTCASCAQTEIIHLRDVLALCLDALAAVDAEIALFMESEDAMALASSLSPWFDDNLKVKINIAIAAAMERMDKPCPP